MPGQGSWPYLPGQCPHCWYFQELNPFVDEAGYEIVGFCRHPRIAMELFHRRQPLESENCPLFMAAVAE